MTDQTEPGSREEAAQRRTVGAGPFTAGKCQCDSATIGEPDGAAVFDIGGEPFALVPDDLAVGGRTGALARATRIAEALNAREGHSKPAPYIDEAGNLCAPAGYGFVSDGVNCDMVPLLNVKVVPAK